MSPSSLFRSIACIAFTLAPAAHAGQISIEVNTTRAVRRMAGGIGASWHAIETPIQGHAGSAWGANPPAGEEAAWKQLYRHADWLGLDWCRVEIEQRMYEPERGRFDWNNPEMRILYRILDWAEKNRTHVFLQQMWGNVAWNAFPGMGDDPNKRVHSGPHSMEDFAEGYAEMVNHLTRTKGYKCIRWLQINNEPGWDWSWWQDASGKPLPITPGLAAVRKALDRRGISLPLSGPDWTDLPELEPSKIDFDQYIGAYDIHSYYANFDGGKKGYPLSVAEKRLGDWSRWAHERNKPMFLSEVGSMAFGWGKSDPGPGSFEAVLKDASLVVRGIEAGADAFNRWSFVNRGDLDGQWQLVDTWDAGAGKLRSTFTPHPNAYAGWALLSRFTALQSEVLETKILDGAEADAPRKVVSAALRSPRGEITVIVVNEADSPRNVAFAMSGLARERTFHTYQLTHERRDRADVTLAPGRSFRSKKSNAVLLIGPLPARSITVYSTYRLGPLDRGVMSEGN